MKLNIRSSFAGLGAAMALATGLPVHGLPVLLNGGFETGFTSWTRVDQLGSEGTFFLQSGVLSPVLGELVPGPPAGVNAAMTDAAGPGSHVLYQDFVASPGPASLSFSLFVGNRAQDFFFPNLTSLDFSSPALNQQVRVDIIRTSADPFSLLAADIVQTLYASAPGNPLVTGYSTIAVDISALLLANAGQTLRLRFAEVDNVAPMQLGLDNVTIAAVPEPASSMLGAIGLAMVLVRARCWSPRTLLRTSRRPAERRRFWIGASITAGVATAVVTMPARADTPTMLDTNLQVSTVLSTGITQPIGIVFLGSINDYLVLEKASGAVKRVIGGVLQATPVLDLAVNSNSERGLLSMVLHPNFPAAPYAYVRWTESSTGADSTAVASVPLLGNRVDRFVWNGTSFTQDINLIQLRARQTDNVAVPGHPGTTNANENGNHNGGVMRFGPDGKLYIYMGDQGRRGWMQNLPNGPFLSAPLVDDTFGGPAPDNAHLTGVILRLNEDGSAPADNPFYATGAAIGGEVGTNLQKIYSYGHRNGFGMAFDPQSGSLWETENADDAYAELTRVVPGMNGGWIQFAGPSSRLADWKFIETTQFGSALQQVRYPPTRAAYTAGLGLSRLLMLPGAVYKDPELSWRYETGPSGTTFVQGSTLGAEYAGTLWIGSARSFDQVGANGGSLYRLKLTSDRMDIDRSADPRLADRVADNLFRAQKFDGTESETLKIATGFGSTPSIEQGPDGNLYVVSITSNAIYRISRTPGS